MLISKVLYIKIALTKYACDAINEKHYYIENYRIRKYKGDDFISRQPMIAHIRSIILEVEYCDKPAILRYLSI